MSEDNKIVDGAKDVVEGVADVTKETVGAVGDVAGEASKVLLKQHLQLQKALKKLLKK